MYAPLQSENEGAGKFGRQMKLTWAIPALGLLAVAALCMVVLTASPHKLPPSAGAAADLAALVQGSRGLQQPRFRSAFHRSSQYGLQLPRANFARSEQESNVQPLGAALAQPAGPRSALLLGYTVEEVNKFKRMTLPRQIAAETLPVITGHDNMMQGTLRDALAPAKFDGAPVMLARPHMHLDGQRFLFLSGMQPQELSDVVRNYGATGLPDPIFAAAVPNNLDRNLATLVAQLGAEDAATRRKQHEESLLEATVPSASTKATDGPVTSWASNVMDFLTQKTESRHQHIQVATAARRKTQKP